MFPRTFFLCLVPVLAAFAAITVHAANQSAALNPDTIIRKAAALQVANDQQTPTLRFTYTKTTPNGVFVKDVIDTQGGEVSRLISINGKPLSPAQNAQEVQRLTALLTHPSDQARHRRNQMQDQRHVDRLIQQLPDAFLFTLAGPHPASDTSILHFTFVPNPRYSPPDLESRAFTGMTGSLWINRSSLHFVKLHDRLLDDIRVGWGIVASFNKGGTVSLVNQNIGHNYWVITHMKLDVDGTAFLFKSIHIHITEDESNFRFLPPNTTWQQAVAMLMQDHATH